MIPSTFPATTAQDAFRLRRRLNVPPSGAPDGSEVEGRLLSGTGILNFHATYSEVPGSLEGLVHNVDPDVLYHCLISLREHFDFVDLDTPDGLEVEGRLCLTFDDGNESVFTEALPVLRSLGLPCTLFLNGIGLEGKAVWREKIRALIKGGRIAAFLARFPRYRSLLPEDPAGFFRASKHPRINSRWLDRCIDVFHEEQGINYPRPTTAPLDWIRAYPGVTYGNHGFRHYLLSSLTRGEQEEEIGRNHDLLAALDVPVSRYFALPFGGPGDLNRDTLEILAGLGYLGVLYANGTRSPAVPWEHEPSRLQTA